MFQSPFLILTCIDSNWAQVFIRGRNGDVGILFDLSEYSLFGHRQVVSNACGVEGVLDSSTEVFIAGVDFLGWEGGMPDRINSEGL